ncbi:acyl-CoA thioesterase [Opitutus terrae]|uniref:Thioesterase superfamily protein n=1 Tax=Opitutus terrae (strain DSM 11246 / JCM 15787 / PB90-1) TaxID=452637 RepID=B1ZX37_OPITP|nr:thioesterase family protein [Opitutus terrae]ACB76089.1 thioesterase superfamily protein [Opitutus terrae PB90-1]
MAFTYHRTIRFADTDAAGVVFFANFFALCHEAYEEALAAGGIDLARFFADTGTIVPIAKSEAEYLRPLRPGERVRVTLSPERLGENSFAIRYEVFRAGPPEKLAARVRTEHVSTSPEKRTRVPLPPALARWVDAG